MTKLNRNIKATDWNLYNLDGDFYNLDTYYSIWSGGNYILFTTHPTTMVVYVGLSYNLRSRIHYSHRTDPRFYDYQPVYVTWLNFFQLGIKDPHDAIKGGIENYLARNFQKPLIGNKWSRNTQVQVEHPLSLLCDSFSYPTN